MQKRYLVSWSGGLDSTYLIHKLLQEGHSVSAFYTALFNNLNKTERETKAIEEIRKIFEENPKFRMLGTNKIEFAGSANCLLLKQVPAWICSVICFADSQYTTAAIGYIMNDDAISYLTEIKAIYDSYRGISDNLPELEFPLLKVKKREAWYGLPETIRTHITWCEEAGHKTCTCHACSRMFYELPEAVQSIKVKKQDVICCKTT
jgi:hypothetical protein